MIRLLTVAIALMTSNVLAEDPLKSLANKNIQAGENYQVDTTDCFYRIRVLDQKVGQVRIQQYVDGVASPPRSAYILGSSHGKSNGVMFVIKDEIRVGMNWELAYGNETSYERVITKEVTKIKKIN